VHKKVKIVFKRKILHSKAKFVIIYSINPNLLGHLLWMIKWSVVNKTVW